VHPVLWKFLKRLQTIQREENVIVAKITQGKVKAVVLARRQYNVDKEDTITALRNNYINANAPDNVQYMANLLPWLGAGHDAEDARFDDLDEFDADVPPEMQEGDDDDADDEDWDEDEDH
jgi:hypothetical protein